MNPPLAQNLQLASKLRAAQPVRVVHVVPNLCTGGMERLVLEIVRRSDPQHVSSHVLCINEQGELGDEAQQLGVSISPLNEATGRNGGLPFRLAARFRSLQADVIHTHGPYAHLYATIAARIAGNCRVIHTMHGFPWPRTRRRRMLNRLSNTLTAYVVAVSYDLADYARRELNVRQGKLRVIHNGIDVHPLVSRCTNDWASRKGAIMVARLSSEKDFESLLAAADLIRQRHPMFRLMLAGDGPERSRVEHIINQRKLHEHVELLGMRSDIVDLLAKAQIFVLSSHTEGLSMALLEAMACGLPVIATSVGGNPEVVVDDDTGFLVPPQSHEELASKIMWLLDNPEQAKWMGEAGRRRAQELFDIRRMVQSYENLYWRSAGRLPSTGQDVSRRPLLRS